ncbi:MAG: diguanylate cyclase (GGDEF)-like protein/PAS domain S-box-containing protein [Moritella sp.]
MKIKYRRRLAWLCQIDNVGTSACAISSWDMEGQIINSLFESTSALVHVKTTDGLILNCSPSWATQFDKSLEAVIGNFESDFYSVSKIASIRSYEHAVLAGERQEYEEWSAFGEANILLHTIKSPLYNEHHKVVAILTISNDLTEVMELNERLLDENSDHLRIEAELSRNSSLLNSVINAAPDPVAFINESGKYVGANKGYCDVLNTDHTALIGMDRQDIISPDRLSWQMEQENELLITGKSVCYEELVHLADHSTRWYEICKRRYVNSANGESGILIIYRDLTERKRIEHALENAIEKFDKLSSTDELTNIANRRTLDCKLRHYWLTHQRESKQISLLFCDVDNFKLYNDNYGHHMGDLVLARVAEAMNSQVRRGSDLLARYGGEEFAVILPNTDEEGAKLLADKMCQVVAELGIEHEHALAEKYVTLSIGIATLCPQYGVNEVQLFENADKALYQAKQQGRNQSRVFIPEKKATVNIELNFDLLES